MYTTLIVRFSEIGTKGKNRSFFEKKLTENIRIALRDVAEAKVKRIDGRILIECTDPDSVPTAIKRLQDVYGIISISPVATTTHDFDDIKQLALTELRRLQEKKQIRTFK